MELKNIRERWIKALRSGRYPQYTEGALSSYQGDHSKPEKNCCLGVVCRVARVPREEWEDQGSLEDFVLGLEVMEALGMSKADTRAAIRLNDDDKLGFQRIADWAENDYEFPDEREEDNDAADDIQQ